MLRHLGSSIYYLFLYDLSSEQSVTWQLLTASNVILDEVEEGQPKNNWNTSVVIRLWFWSLITDNGWSVKASTKSFGQLIFISHTINSGFTSWYGDSDSWKANHSMLNLYIDHSSLTRASLGLYTLMAFQITTFIKQLHFLAQSDIENKLQSSFILVSYPTFCNKLSLT